MRNRPRSVISCSDWSLIWLRDTDAVLVGQVAAHGVLQVGDHARPPHVRLAADAVGVLAADIERVLQHRHVAEGLAVPLGRLARDLAQADAFDLRVRAGEVRFTNVDCRPTASKICAPQ